MLQCRFTIFMLFLQWYLSDFFSWEALIRGCNWSKTKLNDSLNMKYLKLSDVVVQGLAHFTLDVL